MQRGGGGHRVPWAQQRVDDRQGTLGLAKGRRQEIFQKFKNHLKPIQTF